MEKKIRMTCPKHLKMSENVKLLFMRILHYVAHKIFTMNTMNKDFIYKHTVLYISFSI